jgi:hypothetical protein
MKKMNNMYEAPKADVIEMQTTMVLMGSPGGGSDPQTPWTNMSEEPE